MNTTSQTPEFLMDITLPQAILLLTLNDATGKTEDGYYQPALAGAALAELFLLGTIALEAEEVVTLRHKQQLGAFLAGCDAEIGSASKRYGLNHWISTLANQKDFIATLADELCHLGALSKEKTRVFGLFSRTVWPEASPVLETQLKAEMAAAIFEDNGSVDERLCLTIAFAHAVDLLKLNFDADKLAASADRIDAISAGQCLTSTASDAVVKSVQTAIKTAHAMADTVTASIIR